MISFIFNMVKLIVVICFFGMANASIIRNFDAINNRVVGGDNAPDGGIPYQASLRSALGSHFCGGSIIGKKWILTAAHCTIGQSPRSMKVVVGTNSLKRGGNVYSVKNLIVHEEYDGGDIINDISLVELSKDIEFTERIQPISLPEENTEGGADLILTGWGRLSYPGSLPDKLQIIKLTALSVDDCQQIFASMAPVLSSQICSLTKRGEGACHGDSGGPLVEKNNVVGIVSWGVPCAKGFPDVYTRVYSFKDWINSKVTPEKSSEETSGEDNSANENSADENPTVDDTAKENTSEENIAQDDDNNEN